MDKIKIRDVVGMITVFLIWTSMIFFMGRVYEWDKYRRTRDIGVEIQTRIIEYRLGTTTLGRDTFNVIKETHKQKIKADKFN